MPLPGQMDTDTEPKDQEAVFESMFARLEDEGYEPFQAGWDPGIADVIGVGQGKWPGCPVEKLHSIWRRAHEGGGDGGDSGDSREFGAPWRVSLDDAHGGEGSRERA